MVAPARYACLDLLDSLFVQSLLGELVFLVDNRRMADIHHAYRVPLHRPLTVTVFPDHAELCGASDFLRVPSHLEHDQVRLG